MLSITKKIPFKNESLSMLAIFEKKNIQRTKLLKYIDEENIVYLKNCKIQMNSKLPKEIVRNYDIGINLKNPKITSKTPNYCDSGNQKNLSFHIQTQDLFNNGFQEKPNKNIAEIISKKKIVFSMKKLEFKKSTIIMDSSQLDNSNNENVSNNPNLNNLRKKKKNTEKMLMDKYNMLLCDEEKIAKNIQNSFNKLQNIAFSLKRISPNKEIYEHLNTKNNLKKLESKNSTRCYSERSNVKKKQDYDGELFNILEFKGLKFDQKKFEKKKLSQEGKKTDRGITQKNKYSSKILLLSNKTQKSNKLKIPLKEKKQTLNIPNNIPKNNSKRTILESLNKHMVPEMQTKFRTDSNKKPKEKIIKEDVVKDRKYSNKDIASSNDIGKVKELRMNSKHVSENKILNQSSSNPIKNQIPSKNSNFSSISLNHTESQNISKQFDSNNNVEKLNLFPCNSNSSFIELNKTDSNYLSIKNSGREYTQDDMLANRNINDFENRESQEVEMMMKMIKNQSILSKVTENTNSRIIDDDLNISKNNISVLSKISMSNDSISIDFNSEMKK